MRPSTMPASQSSNSCCHPIPDEGRSQTGLTFRSRIGSPLIPPQLPPLRIAGQGWCWPFTSCVSRRWAWAGRLPGEVLFAPSQHRRRRNNAGRSSGHNTPYQIRSIAFATEPGKPAAGNQTLKTLQGLTGRSISEREPSPELNRSRTVARPRDATKIRAVLSCVWSAEDNPVGSIRRGSANLQISFLADYETLKNRDVLVHRPRPPQIRHLAGSVAVGHIRRKHERCRIQVRDPSLGGSPDVVMAPRPGGIDQRDLAARDARGKVAPRVAAGAEEVLTTADPERRAGDVRVNAGDLPIPEKSLGYLGHITEQRLSFSNRQFVRVADAKVVRRVLAGDGLIQRSVVLILHRSEGAAIRVFAVRRGDQLAKCVVRDQVQASGETVFKAGLKRMVRGVAIVLAAGVAVDVRELREGTQRLLELQVSRVPRVGQLEARRDNDRVIDYRGDRIAEQVAVNAPIDRVQLVLILLPRYHLVADHAVISAPKYRVRGHCPLDAELPVREVRHPAGLRIVEEGALLEQIRRQGLRVGNRRL